MRARVVPGPVRRRLLLRLPLVRRRRNDWPANEQVAAGRPAAWTSRCVSWSPATWWGPSLAGAGPPSGTSPRSPGPEWTFTGERTKFVHPLLGILSSTEIKEIEIKEYNPYPVYREKSDPNKHRKYRICNTPQG